MTKPSVLILGARSDIGKAVAHKFAELGHPIQLAARQSKTLGAEKTNLQLRYGVPVTLHEFDALLTETHAQFLAMLPELPEIAVSIVGLMGSQEGSERDHLLASCVMRSNYEGPANILALLANRFEERGSGTLVGVSSVAGERGRATNYVYGSAKAGFTAFLSGLRNRLAKRGVHVVTVLPGYVATKMTEGINLPARLTAQPSEVAEGIVVAVKRKKDVIYVRPVWRLIMLIIRLIPEGLFKGIRM
ncbi:SDR family oxidoreductase [Sinorhizobium saheli]|uniref:Short-chain dehydrogenase n=1 Tax=Sinorhizobium saheli TaxID=36856 RepID=A0A178YUT1_SINSA|nr:SDR family oxidoreductase [Sinorhizobium saheli]MQW86419.1 SDR family oxidoreductase [Sinorhizobium saheli]OAP50495.1 short-chain dehydrogenase [Sinorhizobium saheli]